MQNPPALPHSRAHSATPPVSPQRDSPRLLPPGSPLGVSLESKLPMFGTFRHTQNCPNKLVDIGKRIIHPDTSFPQAREALGCTNLCHIQLANAPEPPRPIAAPTPGFKSALSKVFGDHNVEDIDPQALAEIAALASTYQPTQESAIAADPASSPPLDMMEHSPTATPSPDILVPQTQSTGGESTQDTAMTLGGGQNTDGTGIGDSIHAPDSSLPEERRVRFSSLPPPHQPSTILGTDSGNFTPEKTPYQRHANDLWNLAQQSAAMAKDKGKNAAPLTTTPSQQRQTNTPSSSSNNTANTTNTPNPTGIPQDVLDAPITHAAMLTIMADMENRFELRLRAMENRLLAGRNNVANNNNNPRPQQQQQQQQQRNPNPNTIQILQRPTSHGNNPKTPTANNNRNDAPPPNTNTTTTTTTPTNNAIKQTWAAITATGIDLDGFRLAPARKRNNAKGPGINTTPQQAPSAPSTPHARQRRLIIRSIEKNRRVGKAGLTPAHIRDAVNSATNTKFAYAEYNRQDELVLTTMENLPAEPALRDTREITKALNGLDIFGFDISLDVATVNIVIDSVPLGDQDWTPEDWDLNSEKWSELEAEITDFNPGFRLMDRPKWLRSPSALLSEKKTKSSIMVAVQATDWVKDQLTRNRPYLALFGERCSFRKYIRKDASTHCERCLQFGHHAAHCRLQARCKFCHEAHHTKDHHCDVLYCTAGKGKPCSHTVRKCTSCEETSHFTGDRHCPTRTRARSPAIEPPRETTPPPAE